MNGTSATPPDLPGSSAAAPGATTDLLLPPRDRGEFRPSVIESFSFLFQSDQWMIILLIGGACMFLMGIVPIVPMMFFLDYVLFMIEQRIRFPSEPILEFNFDFFTRYLERGLWPMLAQLVLGIILSLPLSAVSLALVFGTMGLVSVASNGDQELTWVIAVVGIGLGMVLMTVVSVFVYIFMGILWFRSGMSGSFKEAFKIRWALDFIRRCGSTLILGFFGLVFMGMLLNILGMLMLCVGYYATYAWTVMALFHYLSQCYELFLSRGGEPIPLSPAVRLESLGPPPQPAFQAGDLKSSFESPAPNDRQ